MNWEAIGAMGEIIGAIAVLATLYYLSGQIKINSREIERANDYQSAQSVLGTNGLYVQIWQPLMQDNELAAIYLKGIENAPMSKVEEFRFCTYINTFLALIEALINQNEAGVSFDELNDDVETTFDLLNPYLEKILNTVVGKRWLEEEAPSLFTHEFLDALREFGPLRS